MRKVVTTSCLMLCMGMLLFIGQASAQEPPRVPPEQLKAMLGDANVVIIDVRLGPDWTDSDAKIKGAVREDPHDVNSWMTKYPKNKTLVFY